MATEFSITADGTTITGTEGGNIDLTGKNVNTRTKQIYTLINTLIQRSGYGAESSCGENHMSFTPSKSMPDNPYLVDEVDFSSVLPKLSETMANFAKTANTTGFDAAIEEICGPTQHPQARKPAALRATAPQPVTLTDDELRKAIGTGLQAAAIPPAQIEHAVENVMEKIKAARKARKAAPPPSFP